MVGAGQDQEFFLSLLENSTDLISIIDVDGVYKFVGGSVRVILGYEPEEMVGKSAFDYIHEEDLVHTAAALGEAVQNGRIVPLPFRFRAKNGGWRWVETTISNKVQSASIQGYVTNSRDVTERVEEETRKRKSQAHYEALFYNHPDAVFELDNSGIFTRVNKAVSGILGYEDGQILGVHFQEFVHKDDLLTAVDAILNTMQGKTKYLELSVVRKSGEVGILGITVLPVLMHGEVVSLQGIAKDITQQKEHESLVRKHADLVTNIMERIPESLFSLDLDWRYTYVNDYYCQYIDKGRMELMGKRIWEVFPRATTTRFYQECQQVARNGQQVSFEEVVPYKSESTLNFQIYPAPQGIVVHFVDITAIRQAQDRLEKLSLVASKTSNCVMIMNAHREIDWVNEAFELVTGHRLAECAGHKPEELLVGPESNTKTISKMMLKLERGKAYHGEIMEYTKGGNKIWFNLDVTPVFSENGDLCKFIAIRTDITEKKLKEHELVRVAQDLFEQNRDLQQFSYMVSHNLRSPAANLIGLTNVLSFVDKQSPHFDQTVQKIRQSAAALDEVIRDLNYVLSVRESACSLEMEEVNLVEIFEDALSSVRYQMNGYRHAISTEVDPEIRLVSNKHFLYEIFRNLFSNAVKFRKSQQILTIDLKAQLKGNGVELEMRDNGVGMDADAVRTDLFKLYKKFHSGYEGRGVGLFLVKTYLDMLGGTIKLKSAPMYGTTVKIILKCHV